MASNQWPSSSSLMEVSKPGLVSRSVSRPAFSRPAFAGLGLISGLEILVSVSPRSRCRSCALKVSVSLKAICWDHRDLKNSDLKNYHWNSILKTAKWWPTKKFPCAAIVIDKVWHYLFEHIMQVPCTSELYEFLGNVWWWVDDQSRSTLSFVFLVKIWGLRLGLDLGFLSSRSRKGWSWSRSAWSRSRSWSRMVRSWSWSRTTWGRYSITCSSSSS